MASSARTRRHRRGRRFERADGENSNARRYGRFCTGRLHRQSSLADSARLGRLARLPQKPARGAGARAFLRARPTLSAGAGAAAAGRTGTPSLSGSRWCVSHSFLRLAVYAATRHRVGYDGVVFGSDLVHGLRPVGVSAAARQGAALAAARAYFGAARRFETGQRMAYRDGSGATRVVTRVLADSWELLVDDATGEVVRAEDKAAYADGRGKPYRPDPLQKTKAQYAYPGFVDGGGRDAELAAPAMASRA